MKSLLLLPLLFVFLVNAPQHVRAYDTFCTSNANCSGIETCAFNNNQSSGVCAFKPLFHPFTYYDLGATLICIIAGLLSSGGGLGGGGIMVPFFVILWGTPRVAIPLSKATIFGGAIGSYCVTFRNRHPNANRPLIDYNVALAFEPSTLVGTVIGVFLNRVLPVGVVTILLILLLAFTTYRTLTKGVQMWRTEATAILAANRQSRGEADMKASLLSASEKLPLSGKELDDDILEQKQKRMSRTATEVDEAQVRQTQLQAMLDKEARYPWVKVLSLVVLWCVAFALAVVKGGGDATTRSVVGISCGSYAFWLLVVALVPIVVVFWIVVGRYLHRDYQEKLRLGFTFLKGDVQWNKKNIILFPALSTLAGIAAGLLGIGGGMVQGPLMLELAILPHVVSTTAAFMILFTASFTASQFLILGAMPYDYAGWFMAIGFLGAVGGQLGVGWMLKKWGRPSMLIIFIAVVIGVSGLLMGIFGIRNLVIIGWTGLHAFC